ncbi:MAG: hypothetical protein WKF97_08315 [Chitinophagaceae bacterium]
MNYFRVTIELKGKIITGIRKNPFDTDTAFVTFKAHAENYYGSRMLHFDCVQLSNHCDEVKLHLKQQGRTGKTHNEPDNDFGLDPIDEKILNAPSRKHTGHGGGKYRNHNSD